MARGKRGKRKNRRGDSEYTKRSKARQDKRARVAEATGQRGFSVSIGGGKRKRKTGAGGAGGAGGRGRGSGGGGGRASTPWLMYAGIGLGAYLLLSKK